MLSMVLRRSVTVELEVKAVKPPEPTKFVRIDYGPKKISVKPGETFTVTFREIAWDKPLPSEGTITITAWIGGREVGRVVHRVGVGTTRARNIRIGIKAPEKPGKYTVTLVVQLSWIVKPPKIPPRWPRPLAVSEVSPLAKLVIY